MEAAGDTCINDEDITLVPVNAVLELVLPFVHLREPLPGNDFVLFKTGKLRLFVRMSRLGGLELSHIHVVERRCPPSHLHS